MEHRKGSIQTSVSRALFVLLLAGSLLPGASLFDPITVRYSAGDPEASSPFDQKEGPKHLDAGDLNGDGLADVVTANLDGSISVLLALGDGKMSEQILVPARGLLAESSLRAVEVGDWNGDGLLDVAAADIARGGVVVLLGAGNGALTPLVRVDFPAVRALASADLDGDQVLDLVAASSPPDCEGLDECLDPSPEITMWCPPGPLPLPSLAVLRGRGDGTFEPSARLLDGFDGCLYDVACADVNHDGKQDVLALDYTHQTLLLFGGNGSGVFLPPVRIAIPGNGPRAFTLAFVDERTPAGGQPPPDATLDVIVANRDDPSLAIFLGQGSFVFSEARSLPTSPSPRDVAAADLDGDGWVELVATARYSNALQVFHALGDGWFDPEPLEMPSGTSPRHVVLADFTGDGALDAAVNNRVSQDVSLFTGRAGFPGFLISKNFYFSGRVPVDVAVGHFDGDDLPDVATVSLRSHDLRVRRNLGEGNLGGETLYETSFEPSAVAAGELNGDGRLDLAVGSLGAESGPSETGTVLIFLGRGDGTFSGPVVLRDESLPYRPVSLELGDLSGDGVPDIAAGGIQGELVLYRGRGQGTFDPGVRLPSEASGRALNLALGEFDGDGRLDIATSQASLLLSGSDFFSGSWSGPIRHFASGVRNIDKTWFVDTGDLDADGRLDLMLALTFVNPDPIAVFHGNGDGTFGAPDIYAGPDMGVVASIAEDMDGDGVQDIVVGNRCAASVIILKGIGSRKFERSETVNALSVEGLAVADMNQDGRPDLVGVGLGLWLLLNRGSSSLVEPTVIPAPRPFRNGLSINELMTSNRTYADHGGVTPDWVEIFNSGAEPTNLAGWRLRHSTRDGEEREWSFPGGLALGGGQHLVVLCGTDRALLSAPGLVCSAFGLNRGGGESLVLVDAGGAVVDRVIFPAMPADVSYARDFDGSRYLSLNRRPTMGGPNSAASNLEPILSPENPFTIGGGRIGVTAGVFDDVGIAYAAVSFRTEAEPAFTEIPLHDDGGHGDGLAGDGTFGAILPELPAGSSVLYSLRIVDLEGGAVEAPSPQSGNLIHVRVPSSVTLQISEVMADAEAGLPDGTGQLQDWLEVENCGDAVVSLDGLALTKDFFDEDQAWRFPLGLRLAPRERLVVLCGGNGAPGSLQTSFRLDLDGDEVLLIEHAKTGRPAAVIDAIGFGPLPNGASFGRLECGGEPRVLARATPGTANEALVPFRRGDASADGQLNLTDAIFILNFLFLGGDSPSCLDAADTDDSGGVDLTDGIRLLNFLFLGDFAPAAPFPGCGVDTSEDGLPCTAFPACGA